MMHMFMHHPVLKVLRTHASSGYGLLVLRLAVGAVFIYHGWPKLFGPNEGVIQFFGSIGIPSPEIMVPFVGFFEVFGGLGIVLGAVTRFWALALVVNMTVAILAAKGLTSWKSIELEVMLLASSLALMLGGAGKLSVDAMLIKNAGEEHASSLPTPQPPKAS